MARLTLPPSPSTLTPVKREPDADTTAAAAHTPRPPPYKKRRRDRLPVTPTQPLLTPQTIPSGTSAADSFKHERSGEPGLTPTTAPTSVKREPDGDAGNYAGRKTLRPSPPHNKRRLDCPPVTPTQPLFTLQTIASGTSGADSFVDERSEQPGLTPVTAPAPVKREPNAYTGKDAGGKAFRRRQP